MLTESAAGAEAGLDSGAEVGVAVSKDWADGTKSVTLATSWASTTSKAAVTGASGVEAWLVGASDVGVAAAVAADTEASEAAAAAAAPGAVAVLESS